MSVWYVKVSVTLVLIHLPFAVTASIHSIPLKSLVAMEIMPIRSCISLNNSAVYFISYTICYGYQNIYYNENALYGTGFHFTGT